jgi:hypothetical protein
LSGAFWHEVSWDLPLTVLDILLAPLKGNAPPVLTLELLGLGQASPFAYLLEALLDLLCHFYESAEAAWPGRAAAAPLADTCAEVLCRALANREAAGKLEAALDQVAAFLARSRRDPDRLYLPAPTGGADDATSAEAEALQSLSSWQLQMAALALGTACGAASTRRFTVPARVVPKLVEQIGPALVPTLAGGGQAHGWLSLLSVALCIAPQAWPPLQADPCLAAPPLARLLLVTLQALAQPDLEVRPLSRSP